MMATRGSRAISASPWPCRTRQPAARCAGCTPRRRPSAARAPGSSRHNRRAVDGIGVVLLVHLGEIQARHDSVRVRLQHALESLARLLSPADHAGRQAPARLGGLKARRQADGLTEGVVRLLRTVRQHQADAQRQVRVDLLRPQAGRLAVRIGRAAVVVAGAQRVPEPAPRNPDVRRVGHRLSPEADRVAPDGVSNDRGQRPG